MIWREKRALLGVIAFILLLNVVFFMTYRVRYQQRVDELHQRLEAQKVSLEQARQRRMGVEKRIGGFEGIEKDIKWVRSDLWSTPDVRLVALIVEINRLARQSQLVPRSISYSLGEARDGSTPQINKADRGTVMSISFSVAGSYQQVRRLLNLIELSKQFVIIDSVTLGGAETPDRKLQLDIGLKTVFSEARELAPSGM